MDYEAMLKRAQNNLPKKKEGERFEMPNAIITRSGKQTFIKNFLDITKTIRREPKHMAKYLFKELAVPGAITGNELMLQGKLDYALVKKRVSDYIQAYVLCQECGKPDTNLLLERGITFIKCEACGARRSARG